MRKTVEIILHTLNYHHSLTVAIGGESHVLQCLGCNLHFFHLSNLGENRVVGRCRLSLHWHDLQLWVDICEE